EADVPAILRNIHLCLELLVLREISVAVGEFMGKNIGHGDELRRAARGRKGVFRGPRSPTAAAHQRQLNSIAFAGVKTGKNDLRKGARGGDFARVFEQLAAAQARFRRIVHGETPCSWWSADR